MKLHGLRCVAAPLLLAATFACSPFLQETGHALLDTGSDYLRQHKLDKAASHAEDFGRHLAAQDRTRQKLTELQAIAEAGDTAALQKVQGCLQDADSRVRLAAVQALRCDRSSAADAAMLERTSSDADQAVRSAAAAMLALRAR